MSKNQNHHEENLSSLRKKIDEIDNKIISLLCDRMDVISQVGELKKSNQESFFIKSAREADMIKNLIKNPLINFSKSTIVSIWRKIITLANMKEQKISIAIHNPHSVSSYSYLVREYYSKDVPIDEFDSATGVVMEIENKRSQIAVFCLPNLQVEDQLKIEDIKENWWISLANNRIGINVFAKIPFVCSAKNSKINEPQLLISAIKQPEKSSDDFSLLCLEVDKKFSKLEVLNILKNLDLTCKIIKSVKINQIEGVVFYLIEIKGFYLLEDDKIQSLIKSEIKPFAKIIGHYPELIYE